MVALKADNHLKILENNQLRGMTMSKSTHAVNSREDIQKFETILLSNLDEKAFFGNLGHALKANFNCDRAIVFKSMDDGTPIFISDSECPNITSYVLEKGKGVAGHVIRNSRPYYSNNTERDPIFQGVKESEGYGAELCVPIIVEGQTIATVHLQNKEADSDFDQQSINQVQEFLNYLERPLHNMKMYLAAKHLNEVLREEIERKDKRSGEWSRSVQSHSLYNIEDVEIIGQSAIIKEICKIIPKLAKTANSILIEGASGVGKEMIAKKIHMQSRGKGSPFVVVNASTLTEENFEKEMFGHVQGAFMGTNIGKIGFCELAHKGTLFLDHVGDLTPSVQAKILRFLGDQKIYKIGSQEKEIDVNVQVIASFNGNLQTDVEEGRFREDLYFILKGFSVNIPHLKERGNDIELLANFFLNENKSAMDRKELSPEALTALKTYYWPGNVRELKNAMERAYFMSEGKGIRIDHLPEDILNFDVQEKKQEEEYVESTLQELERKHITRTLEFAKGNKTKAARTLGITVKTLYNKLHSYGAIRPESVERGKGSNQFKVTVVS